MKPAQLLLVGLVGVALASAGACSSQDTPGNAVASGGGAGAPDAAPGGAAGAAPSASAGKNAGAGSGGDTTNPTFGASDCRACQAKACASAEADCTSEPSCAKYLECIDACPTAADGGVDRDCAAACELPASSANAILATAVTSCRDTGHGLSCNCGERTGTVDILQQTCPASTETNGCFKCEDEHCCDTYAACKADDDCTAFMTCVKTCPDSSVLACKVSCGAEHPAGYELGLRRLACVLLECADGDQCGNGPIDPCYQCVATRCGNESVACDTDPGCTRVSACAEKCGSDPKCQQACNALDDAGAALFGAFATCGTMRCAAECG